MIEWWSCTDRIMDKVVVSEVQNNGYSGSFVRYNNGCGVGLARKE